MDASGLSGATTTAEGVGFRQPFIPAKYRSTVAKPPADVNLFTGELQQTMTTPIPIKTEADPGAGHMSWDAIR